MVEETNAGWYNAIPGYMRNYQKWQILTGPTGSGTSMIGINACVYGGKKNKQYNVNKKKNGTDVKKSTCHFFSRTAAIKRL